MDPTVVHVAVDAVAAHFGRAWLEQPAPHPLRDLWMNLDGIATCQLYWLGAALIALSLLKPAWVADVVSKMKSDHASRVGFAFELLVLPMFALSGHGVTLAKPGQEGFDADIRLKSGRILRLSLKNFGTSKHSRTFSEHAGTIRDALVKRLLDEQIPAASALVMGVSHPKPSDWTTLASAIESAHLSGNIDASIGDQWALKVRHDPTEAAAGPGWLSSSIAIIAPHHANERKNFLDKIASECGTFNRKAASYDTSIDPAVMFRLADSAPILDYLAWAGEYVNRPDVRLSGVLFMQSAVTFNTGDSATSISHYLHIVWKDELAAPEISLAAPVGLISGNPIREVLIAGGELVDASGFDWYSRIERFVKSVMSDDGSVQLQTPSHPPGTLIHGILEVPGGGPGIVLSPRHQTPDHVLLYD